MIKKSVVMISLFFGMLVINTAAAFVENGDGTDSTKSSRNYVQAVQSGQSWSSGDMTVTIDTPLSAITIDEEESVNFTGSVHGGTAPYTYGWSFGGISYSEKENPGNITFDSAGIYEIVFLVMDSHQAIAFDSIRVTVEGKGTVESLLACAIDTPSSALTVTPGDAVNFTGSALGGTAPYSFWWEFGGMGGSALEDPGFISFTAAGSYTVIYYVKDSLGTVVSDTVTITVKAPVTAGEPLTCAIGTPSSALTVTAGDAVNFTGSALGGTAPYSFWWEFGGMGGSGLEDPGFVSFTAAGSYTVIYYVKDSLGTVVSDTVTVTVNNNPNPTLENSYVGPWSGTFFGTDSGTWSVTIDANGTIKGSAYSNALKASFSVNGSIDDNGHFVMGNASSGTEFSGQVGPPGTISGTWVSHMYYNDHGNFIGQQQ